MALPAALRAQPQWLFKPAGTNGAADYASPGLDDSDWETVALPHRTWDASLPGSYVYGWYRYHFTPDPSLSDCDMVLKIGVVDDVDETYCNGTRIGGTGSFPPQTSSAYCTDREYLMPSHLLVPGEDNVLAVKAFDTIGTGGLLGVPRLGYRLSTEDQWQFRPTGVDCSSDYSGPDVDDSNWERVPMPDETWDARQPGDGVCGWYRLHFPLPATLRGKETVLDLGIVLDSDETYLNGKRIGRTGAFPPEAARGAGGPRLYRLPEHAARYGGDNVLAVKVFNGEARGGIWGRPAVLACDAAATQTEEALLARASAARHAGDFAAAFEVLAVVARRSGATGFAPRLLDESVALYEAVGRDADALAAFRHLVESYPAHCPSPDAVAAACCIQERLGPFSDDASYLGEDRNTRGDWWLSYGADGFVLSAMGHDCDVFGTPGWCAFRDPFTGDYGSEPPFGYDAMTSTSAEHQNWQGAGSTSDRRALQNPVTGGRTYACWDDKGEEHPFDNDGPDLLVRFSLPAGWWRVAAYLVDWDWHGTWHPRSHGLLLADESGELLAVADTGKFGQGVWELFACRGPRTVVLRVIKGRSNCAILSGLFLDRLRVPASPPEELLVTAAEDGRAKDLAERYGKLAAPGAAPWASAAAAARSLAAEVDAELRRAEPPGAQRSLLTWMSWHLRPWESAAEMGPRAAEFVRTVRAEHGPQTADIMLAAAALLYAQGRYGGAQYLDRALCGLDGTSQDAGALDPSMAAAAAQRWLVVDPRFSAECFDAALRACPEGPPTERITQIAALGAMFADQPVVAWPQIRGPIPSTYDRRRIPFIFTLAYCAEKALVHSLVGTDTRAHLEPCREMLQKRLPITLASLSDYGLGADPRTGATLAAHACMVAGLTGDEDAQPLAARHLSAMFRGCQDTTHAAKLLAEILTAPVVPAAAAYLAEEVLGVGMLPEAVALLKSASTHASPAQLPELAEALVRCYIAAGQWDEALRTFQAVTSTPLDDLGEGSVRRRLRMYRLLGTVCAQTGNREALVAAELRLETLRDSLTGSSARLVQQELDVLRVRRATTEGPSRPW